SIINEGIRSLALSAVSSAQDVDRTAAGEMATAMANYLSSRSSTESYMLKILSYSTSSDGKTTESTTYWSFGLCKIPESAYAAALSSVNSVVAAHKSTGAKAVDMQAAIAKIAPAPSYKPGQIVPVGAVAGSVAPGAVITKDLATVGTRVVRGKDWKWSDQDGGPGKLGTIIEAPSGGWVRVKWDNGHENSYRVESSFDLAAAPSGAVAGAIVTKDIAKVGLRVVRGKDWKWEDQDGGPGKLGTIKTEPSSTGWVRVLWDNGHENSYRVESAFDLAVASSGGLVVMPSSDEPMPGADVTKELAKVGLRVVRGKDWKWDDQDGGPGKLGTIKTEPSSSGWVRVKWDTGDENSYRVESATDLRVAPAEYDARVADGPVTMPPVLSIEDIKVAVPRIEGGKKTDLTFLIRNLGPGDGRNVYVEPTCTAAGVSVPKKITVPTIAASGGVQKVTITLEGSMDLKDGDAYVDIKVTEPNFKVKVTGKRLLIPTVAMSKPALTVAKFAVVESSSASPNGMVDINEVIDLRLAIQNLGSGTAEMVKVEAICDQKGVMYL
ncbi:MAG: hypothetical protein JXM71_11945, partial [Spirochaetales bacterium]|nr:hypothetical protein [Spirochaetales bacterium]